MKINHSKINIMTNKSQAHSEFGYSQKDLLFQNILKKEHSDLIKNEIEELLKKIDMQREVLINNLSMPEVNKYKEIISSFLKKASKYMEIKEHSFFDNRGRHKLVKNSKIINQSLEKLARETLKANKDPLLAVELTKEIRGLIIDIMA